MDNNMAIVLGVVVAVVLQSVAGQTGHIVGGSMGWSIPQSGAQEYVTWAANNKFVVGDTLVFNFATNAHDVQQVSKASFESCNSDNPIGSAITTGPANVTLNSSGDHYFICTYGRHCQSGQKLAITVSGPSASPRTAPFMPPPPPTANPTPTTPSPTSSNDPAACEPVPAPSPSTNPVSPPPLGSSSPAVLASFFLSSSALVMGLFF